MRIDKVDWITAQNCGKLKLHSFTPCLSWKGKLLGLDIVSQNVICPRKQTTEPKFMKLVILVSFYSGDVISYTESSYCIHILREVCRSLFFWATLYKLWRVIGAATRNPLRLHVRSSGVARMFQLGDTGVGGGLLFPAGGTKKYNVFLCPFVSHLSMFFFFCVCVCMGDIWGHLKWGGGYVPQPIFREIEKDGVTWWQLRDVRNNYGVMWQLRGLRNNYG